MRWLIDGFRRDARIAINATPARRWVSFGSMVFFVALALIFGAVAPWWIWLVALAADGIVFLYLGDRWAAKDARKAAGRAGDSR